MQFVYYFTYISQNTAINNLLNCALDTNTAAILNVKYPDIQKDITTYITISNDVLNFYYIKAHHLS